MWKNMEQTAITFMYTKIPMITQVLDQVFMPTVLLMIWGSYNT